MLVRVRWAAAYNLRPRARAAPTSQTAAMPSVVFINRGCVLSSGQLTSNFFAQLHSGGASVSVELRGKQDHGEMTS